MLSRRQGWGHRKNQSGMSIVELMVGVAVGLMVTAAASLLMSGQLVENRRLVTETQLQQDLRAATDIMTRELRRTGAAPEDAILKTIWFPGASIVESNTYAEGLSTPAGEVIYNYNPASTGGPYGYKQVGSVLRVNLAGGSGWQDLTDSNIMNVQVNGFTPQFTVEPTLAAIVLPCPNLCPGGGIACWPKIEVRLVSFAVAAEAKRDSTVQRAITSAVRVRNDRMTYNSSIPAPPPGVGSLPQLCPA